mgnify:CR=1 FL=1
MNGIIYGLIDSDTLELRYIGKTTKPLEKRLCRHMQCRTRNHHLNRWLRARPVNIIVLERDPIDLNETEMCWIADMREQGARLLNMTDGGGGSTGVNHSVEARAKMRAAKLGRKLTVEHRAKMSAAKLGRKFTAEHRSKLSAAGMGNQNALGHRHTIEARAKMSLAAKSRFCEVRLTEEEINGASKK